MSLTPTLIFNGRAEEALEHYRDALGGELEILRFDETPMACIAGDQFRTKVAHATLRSPFGNISAADVSAERGGGHAGDNFTLAVETNSAVEVDKIFTKLAAGGRITTELQPTFFSARFGTLTDRFGIQWMVLVSPTAVAGEKAEPVSAVA